MHGRDTNAVRSISHVLDAWVANSSLGESRNEDRMCVEKASASNFGRTLAVCAKTRYLCGSDAFYTPKFFIAMHIYKSVSGICTEQFLWLNVLSQYLERMLHSDIPVAIRVHTCLGGDMRIAGSGLGSAISKIQAHAMLDYFYRIPNLQPG